MTTSKNSVVTIDVPDLDLDAGTYILRWREDGQARNALLFLGHVIHRAGDPRGEHLVRVAREAGGLAPQAIDEIEYL